MASITIIAVIDNVRFLPDSVILNVTEFKKGYRKSDGTRVADRFLSWKTVWKPYFKKYINEHFHDNMVVEIHGEVLPYAVENGQSVEGYSVLGKTIDLFSAPRPSAHLEQKAVKESLIRSDREPDLESYQQPDF